MTANDTSRSGRQSGDSNVRRNRDDSTTSARDGRVRRRTVLGTGAALTAFGVAGCLGGGGDDGSENDSSEGTNDEDDGGNSDEQTGNESDDGWGEEQESEEGDGSNSSNRAGEYTGPHSLPFEDQAEFGSHAPLHDDSDFDNIVWDEFKSWRMPARPEAQEANDVDPEQLGEAPGKELYANPSRYIRNELKPANLIYELESAAGTVQVEVQQELRFETGSIAIYESTDGGESWTELEMKEDVYDPAREGTEQWKSSLYTAEGLSDEATFVRVEITGDSKVFNPEIGWVGIE